MARPKGSYPVPELDRFWDKITKTEECWFFGGGTAGAGYGYFQYAGGRRVYAHRYMWELHNGPIPAGFEVCHSCDVRNCVRPDHLWLGTHKQNEQDKVAKGRHHNQKTHCVRGHDNWRGLANGKRECRTCRAAFDKRKNDRKRAT